VLLITCWSAKDNAMGTRLSFHGLRGVIRIMREVIDKAGLNRLLDPHQSPFPLFPFSQTILCLPSLPPTSCCSIPWAIPWVPSSLPLNAITGVSSASKRGQWWLRIPILLPSIVGRQLLIWVMICLKTSTWVICSKIFLLLGYQLTIIFCRVMANKQISRHRLLVDTAIKGNL
jgi:hypothetical protein